MDENLSPPSPNENIQMHRKNILIGHRPIFSPTAFVCVSSRNDRSPVRKNTLWERYPTMNHNHIPQQCVRSLSLLLPTIDGNADESSNGDNNHASGNISNHGKYPLIYT